MYGCYCVRVSCASNAHVTPSGPAAVERFANFATVASTPRGATAWSWGCAPGTSGGKAGSSMRDLQNIAHAVTMLVPVSLSGTRCSLQETMASPSTVAAEANRVASGTRSVGSVAKRGGGVRSSWANVVVRTRRVGARAVAPAWASFSPPRSLTSAARRVSAMFPLLFVGGELVQV